MTSSQTRQAAVLVIGDEILSGRTQEANIGFIAGFLAPLGIGLAEARVVRDATAEIAAAVNALRARYDYVFTTGGIGPTHDDITADAVAAAFGAPIEFHAEALRILEAHYPPGEFNEARRRMARIPQGAHLIENPVSKAPGFQIENVFVLAGVPRIMQAMLEGVRGRLAGGPALISRSAVCYLPEGKIAAALGALQAKANGVSIGSYPFYRLDRTGTTLVARGTDACAVDATIEAVKTLVVRLGGADALGEVE